MIREGRVDDLPDIIRMSREFWKTTIYDEPFCEDDAGGMAEMCLNSGIMLICEEAGEIIGFACGIIGPLLANSGVLAGTEVAYWISPDYRGRQGITLLRELEKSAKEKGVKYWAMVAMQSSMPEKVGGLYRKMGYELNEQVFTKVL